MYAKLVRAGKGVFCIQYYFVQGKVCYVCNTISCRERCVMYAILFRAGQGVSCNTKSCRERCVMQYYFVQGKVCCDKTHMSKS